MLNSLPYFPHTITVWFRTNISNLTFSGDQSVELECFKIKSKQYHGICQKEILLTFVLYLRNVLPICHLYENCHHQDVPPIFCKS